jgi:hypothetical protein
MGNLGGSVAELSKHRSSVSRFFAGHWADILTAMNHATRRLLNRSVKAARATQVKRWILVIDTTFQRKHALTMDNLILFKDKKKGVPSQNHGFVVGILIGPGGVRIPLPVPDFYTKKYFKQLNEERRALGLQPMAVRKTQIDLAVDLVRTAREWIPADIELWVMADNFFEGPKLDKACNNLFRTYYVTPLDTKRVITSSSKSADTAFNGTVRSFEKLLPEETFRKVALVSGKEAFAALCRREPVTRRRGRPQERIYRVARRVLPLSGLGERPVFFSWKDKRFTYDTSRAKSHLKMLVTNCLHATAEEVVSAYLLRWQVELFFRELKSDLGLGHYQMETFEAITGHIHAVLLAAVFLELYRLEVLEKEPGVAARYKVCQSRTRQLALLCQSEAKQQEVERLEPRLKRPGAWEDWLPRLLQARLV